MKRPSAPNSFVRPYWRSTRVQMIMCLIVPCLALPMLPFVISALRMQTFLGFPLGYLIAFHGFFALGFAIVAWFVRRQDAIDHLHRANEDH